MALERPRERRRGSQLDRREDLDEPDRLGNTLDRSGSPRRVAHVVVPAGQVGDGLAREDLAPLSEAAQPSSDVQRTAAIASRGRDRLADVEPDPDAEWKCGLALGSLAGTPLQLHGSAHRRARGREHA